MNVPKLRFPGFEGEWKALILCQIAIKIGDGIHSTPSYSESGEYHFVNGNNLIDGKIVVKADTKRLDEYEIKKYQTDYGQNTILLSINGTIGNIALYRREQVLLGKSVSFIALENFYVMKFIYFHLFSDRIQTYFISELTGSTIQNLSLAAIRRTPISLPTLPEQQKIAEFLSSVDNVIQLLTKKKTLLENYKKGIMQKIFSQEIRFKDDDGNDFPEWEEKRLGEVADKIGTKNNQIAISRVFTNSATKGLVNQQEYFDKNIANPKNLSGYYIVHKDDFVYNPRISSSAPVGPISRNHNGSGLVSPLYWVFRFKKGNLDFFEKYFQSILWHDYMKSIANYGARSDRMNITIEGFYGMPIILPSLPEQQKIADFLSGIDRSIEIVNSQIEKAKEYKKGLLQQMFV